MEYVPADFDAEQEARARDALNAMAANVDKLPAADLTQVAELRKLAESGYAVMPEN